MTVYLLEKYVAKIINDRKITLEVRSVRNTLYMEKLEFMKENMSSEEELFFEIIEFPYVLVDSIKSHTSNGMIRIINSRSYMCEQKQVIYVLWMDKNKNIIKPDTWLYKFARKGDMFTVN